MVYWGMHASRVVYDSNTVTGTLQHNYGNDIAICSMCQRKGMLMWFVPRDALTLRTPEANASTYTFNKHHIKHHFCPTCGIHPYGEATNPSGQPMAAINLRCVDGVDLKTLPVTEFNGRAL